MTRALQLLAVFTLFCGSGLFAAGPWEKTSESVAANPFVEKAFIRYPGSKVLLSDVRYLDVYMFTSETTGKLSHYLLGVGYRKGWEGRREFSYRVDTSKKQIFLKTDQDEEAYKYTVSGRIATLSNIEQTQEWVEAVRPFFWLNDEWHGVGDKAEKYARQDGFLKNYIEEARRTSGGAADPTPTPAPENPAPDQISVSQNITVLPVPAPIQIVEFLAAPVDKTLTKFMLKRISTGDFRDKRVYELKEAAKAGQIVNFDGVPAVVLAYPKTKARPAQTAN